ncbi:hypothetical protein PIB30_059982 [Stylosanthes scabra]|uniref:Uncharacterized protein n=1 Tax=Stylosanthes scabra TaxID=79078 RepID=A0ABU6ZJ42_9FABA|nr:hypothetical protein [Stylosanthes scabra]
MFIGLIATTPLHSPLRPLTSTLHVDAFNHTNPSSSAATSRTSAPFFLITVKECIPCCIVPTNPHLVIAFAVSASPHSSLRRGSHCQRFHRRCSNHCSKPHSLFYQPLLQSLLSISSSFFCQVCAQVLLPQLLIPFSLLICISEGKWSSQRICRWSLIFCSLI